MSNHCYRAWKSKRRQKANIQLGRASLYWKCAAFLSGSDVDDGSLFLSEEDVYDFQWGDFIDFMDTSDTRHHTDMKVSLLDIARPAKQKGAAKDFEVVQKVRNVVALEDDFEGLLGYQWEDDEWVQIYEQHATERRSYSSVLSGLNAT